jgi:hypothetical protein
VLRKERGFAIVISERVLSFALDLADRFSGHRPWAHRARLRAGSIRKGRVFPLVRLPSTIQT